MLRSLRYLCGMGMLFAAFPLTAAMVTIQNPGFDLDAVRDGDSVGGAFGWMVQSSGSTITAGIVNPTSSVFGAVPSNQNVAFISDGSISQVLDELLRAATRYTLEVKVGRRKSGGPPFDPSGYQLQLLAGGTLLEAALSQGPDDLPLADTFVDVELVYVAGPGDPIGQALEIRLLSDTTVAHFDDVRLDATVVPLPGALGLLAGALIGLGAVRRPGA